MNKVKVLIRGYAKEVENGWLANSTVTLVQSDDKNILIDPGCDRERLLEELENNGLKTADIDYVFLTHNHIDHALLAGIFETAKIVDEFYVCQKDIITKHGGVIPETNLKIIHTPGHKEEHCSLIVETKEGIYAIAGDVFWWLENENQEVNVDKPDNDSEHMNIQKLIESRKRLLEIANFIIPGHGKMFETNK